MFSNQLEDKKDKDGKLTAYNRSYVGFANTDPAKLYDFKFTVNEDTGVQKTRTVSRGYEVSEEYPEGPHRVFLVCKDKDAGRDDLAAGRVGKGAEGDVYECRIAVMHGHPNLCTCPCGAAKKHVCVHVETLSKIVAEGQIPDPRESGCDSQSTPSARIEEPEVPEHLSHLADRSWMDTVEASF
jgi:hypothetical protein